VTLRTAVLYVAVWIVVASALAFVVGRILRGPRPDPVAERRRLVVVPDRVPPEWLREHGSATS
jgi:hypothetical protein